MRYRETGYMILPGSSGERRKVIGKVISKTWVFLCLPPWKDVPGGMSPWKDGSSSSH